MKMSLVCLRIDLQFGRVWNFVFKLPSTPRTMEVLLHYLLAQELMIRSQMLVYYCSLLLSHFSHVRLCATPQTAAHQAPPSLGFSRQKHWSGPPFPSPMHESEKSEVAQSCLTLSDPMVCSLPGSSVHGIFQARVLEWVPLPSPIVPWLVTFFLFLSFVVVQSLSHIRLFCDLMYCSPPGSSVHGIFQAKILEWVAISFSKGFPPCRDLTCISCTHLLFCRWILYHWATKEALLLSKGCKNLLFSWLLQHYS